ncbi:hypothetical protein SLEP1_g53089 [Rubroshorea leprosula]|uniref:Retrovirus-related Pol polyprotein from transposon TNT 1-94-like beta-barrel domain-containing protein n=1 Tax=Rubroshorea leprosula TaxID=152421 RepID=A0AAV5MC69_9ROSI|nr:hypothetical protein SLEP1_g53089 [Rubroshorea leprosula]
MMMTRVVNAGDIFQKEEKALLLLAFLPKSYKSLVQSMLVGNTTLVMKDVTTMLLENDKSLGEDDGANQNNALVMEQDRGRSQGCGETKGKGEAKIVEENLVEVLACEKCDLEVEQNNQRWILDSAATMHMCNNPSEFMSLVWGELGKITMATDEKVNIEGMRDVHLNVHNKRAQILKNVYKGGRLVLHRRKNKHNIYVLEQHLERGLNKTMRKMVWKPKGILVNGKEINKIKKKVSCNNEVVFDDGLRSQRVIDAYVQLVLGVGVIAAHQNNQSLLTLSNSSKSKLRF